ncbi:MAG: hypothetical protein R3E12_13295 [Candidatus Eisenbacteria bacterium]
MNFVEQTKPEACYFTTENGKRTGLLLRSQGTADDASIAEPFFVNLHSIDVAPARTSRT